jgi:hypothetical protein
MRAVFAWSAGLLLAGCGGGGAVGDLEKHVSRMSAAVEDAVWEFEGSFPLPPTTLLKGYELVLTDSSMLDLRHFRCSKRDDSAPTVELCDAEGDYKWEREVSSWPLRQIDAATIAVKTGTHAGETTHSLTFSCDFEADCEDNLRFNLVAPMMIPCASETSCNQLAGQLAEAVTMARSDAVRAAAREHLTGGEAIADRKGARARLGEVNLLADRIIDDGASLGANGWIRLDDELGLSLKYYRCENSERDRDAAARACRKRQPYPNPLEASFALPAAELAGLTVEVPNDGRDLEVVLHCAAEPCFTMRFVHDARDEYRPGRPQDPFVVGCAVPEDCTAIAQGLRDIIAYVADATPVANAEKVASETESSEEEYTLVDSSAFELHEDDLAALGIGDDDWEADSALFGGPDLAALQPLVHAINEDLRSGVADDGDLSFAIGATLSDDHWASLVITTCDAAGESAIERCRDGTVPTEQWNLTLLPLHIAADSLAVRELPVGAVVELSCVSGEPCIVNDDGAEEHSIWLPCTDVRTCERVKARFTDYLQLFKEP